MCIILSPFVLRSLLFQTRASGDTLLLLALAQSANSSKFTTLEVLTYLRTHKLDKDLYHVNFVERMSAVGSWAEIWHVWLSMNAIEIRGLLCVDGQDLE